MPLIYALVARGTTVLAEHTSTGGNFALVTRRILEKLPPEDASTSYAYDAYLFHYHVRDGLTFLCLADDTVSQQLFLEEVRRRWAEAYADRGRSALAYAMNEDFAPVLRALMTSVVPGGAGAPSSTRGAAISGAGPSGQTDAMARVQGEVEEARTVIVESFDKILEHGEKIELLVDKTELLHVQASPPPSSPPPPSPSGAQCSPSPSLPHPHSSGRRPVPHAIDAAQAVGVLQ